MPWDLLKYSISCTKVDFQTLEVIIRQITSSYDISEYLHPLEPDILGETFFLMFIEELSKKDIRSYGLEQAFVKILCSGGKELLESDSAEFIGFITRMARNLCNDDQEDINVRGHWKALMWFLDYRKYISSNPVITWGTTSALATIAEFIESRDDKAINKNKHNKRKELNPIFKNINLKEIIDSINTDVLYTPYDRNDKFYVSCLLSCTKYTDLLLRNKDIHPSIDKEWTLLKRMSAIYEKENKLKGENFLHYASRHGFLHVVRKLLLESYDVDQCNEFNQTALMFACMEGHSLTAKHLIENNSDINIADQKGRNALIYASNNGHIEIVRILIDNGASLNLFDNIGCDALWYSSWSGNKDVVECLIESGADINHINNFKQTALFIASDENHLGIVDCLLKNGADLEITDKYGFTPFLCACRNGSIDVVKYMAYKGISIDSTDKYGATGLSYSSEYGHMDIVKYFVSQKANIQHKDIFGWTPFMIACGNGYINIANFLLKNGVNINDSNYNGYTALLYASDNGYLDVVEFLVNQGADINHKDVLGETALDKSRNNGYNQLTSLLLSLGATED